MASKKPIISSVLSGLIIGIVIACAIFGLSLMCDLASMAGPADNRWLVLVSIFGVLLTWFITRKNKTSYKALAQFCYILPIIFISEMMRVSRGSDQGNLYMNWRLLIYVTTPFSLIAAFVPLFEKRKEENV